MRNPASPTKATRRSRPQGMSARTDASALANRDPAPNPALRRRSRRKELTLSLSVDDILGRCCRSLSPGDKRHEGVLVRRDTRRRPRGGRYLQGGAAKNLGSDPLARLLPVGNQGGFRAATQGKLKTVSLVVLFTTLDDPDWPDHLDVESGRFTYYGDNKHPGHTLHETQRGGNALLRRTFAAIHAHPPERLSVPAISGVHAIKGMGRAVPWPGSAWCAWRHCR